MEIDGHLLEQEVKSLDFPNINLYVTKTLRHQIKSKHCPSLFNVQFYNWESCASAD
jgi:hypothetical protein